MKSKRLKFILSMSMTVFLAMLCCSVILSLSKEAFAFTLPDTGQTKCYYTAGAPSETNVTATAGAEISCDGTGQDGEYSINPMSYTDNGNGTVTDNVTGLMWQKEDDNKDYNPYPASGTYHATYNPTSQSVCGSLSLGGYSDWRLPTIKELFYLVDFSVLSSGPQINTTYFPNTKGGNSVYWSSTINNGVDMSNSGRQAYGYGDGTGSRYYYCRCVRGAQPSPSFTKSEDGQSVTDNVTGLTWERRGYGTGWNDSDGQYHTLSYVDWAGALKYCKNLNTVKLSGYSDWRLPNIKELFSIVDITYSIPTSILNSIYDTTYFVNNAVNFFSSTTDPDDIINNLGVNGVRSAISYYKTGIAEISTAPKVMGGDNYDYVRCVRGGQSTGTDITQGTGTANCAATISPDLVVHIPILTYSGSNYWVDLTYDAVTSAFPITNGGLVSDMTSYSSCTVSTLSSDFQLYIPALLLGDSSYWLDLLYGSAGFVITGAGQN